MSRFRTTRELSRIMIPTREAEHAKKAASNDSRLTPPSTILTSGVTLQPSAMTRDCVAIRHVTVDSHMAIGDPLSALRCTTGQYVKTDSGQPTAFSEYAHFACLQELECVTRPSHLAEVLPSGEIIPSWRAGSTGRRHEPLHCHQYPPGRMNHHKIPTRRAVRAGPAR